jgi:hypothetical protein
VRRAELHLRTTIPAWCNSLAAFFCAAAANGVLLVLLAPLPFALWFDG